MSGLNGGGIIRHCKAAMIVIGLGENGRFAVKTQVNGPVAGMNPDLVKFLKEVEGILSKQLNSELGKFPPTHMWPMGNFNGWFE